jgi:hypothetical protein
MTIYYKTLIIVVGTILILLIVNTVFRKIKPSSHAQIFTHILLYLFEITIVTSLINYLIMGYQSNTDTPLNILRNHIFAYTLYQLLLFVFFKLKDSTEADSLATIKNLADMYQVYAEFDKPIPDEDIDKSKKEFNSPRVTLSNKHRDIINYVNLLAENYNSDKLDTKEFRMQLKQISRDADFQAKMFNLSWMNSLLLRMFK